MPRPVIPAALRQAAWQIYGLAQDALRWWLGEVQGMIPGFVREALSGRVSPLLLYINPDALIVREDTGEELARLPLPGHGNQPEDLAQRIAEAGAIRLVLPKNQVLRRTLDLPLSAERELGAALSFEVDRQTPFRLDQVYHRYRILERRLDRKTLQVELVVAPRAVVDQALKAAAVYGLVADAAWIEGDASKPRFDLLPRRPILEARNLLAEPWRPILAAATLLLILGLGGIAWYRHDQALALTAEVAARRPIGHRAQTLRDEIRTAETAAQFFPEKRRTPSAIEILDTLSRVLPDDSWVFGLELTPKEVRIEGFAADVPLVIDHLQQASIFETPQLRSPVARSQANSRDRFDLALALKQVPP